MDSNLRTFIKTLSYRIVAVLTVFALSILLDYGAGFGMKFVIITMTLGFVIFFTHERVWNKFTILKDGVADTIRRSIYKTISWRIVSFIVLFIIGMVLGLSSESALSWTIANNIAFIGIHYLHERLWNRISWGKKVNVSTV